MVEQATETRKPRTPRPPAIPYVPSRPRADHRQARLHARARWPDGVLRLAQQRRGQRCGWPLPGGERSAR
jgi:hypothetical protein